ncbi:MAG: RNA polymerase sigma factor [Gemmatimonadota bacterium]|nr:RNA polymerase sigma factor [Gemmatimonadota bacterium]
MVISDAAAVSRIRGGETDVFSVLFDRYYDRCVGLALRLLGDPDDAADAVQDSFIRAYLSLDRYQDRDRFSSWLLCIVANRCRTASAVARRRASVANDWMHLHADADTSEILRERDHLLAQRLEDALHTLPATTRSVVLRKFGDDLTYEEISADTGVAVSALKMRVSRGSAQLRRTLAGAGVTVATVALLFLTHTNAKGKPHAAAAAVACDTLRAIMYDTLPPATRDSMLAAQRCSDERHAAPHAPRHVLQHAPQVHGSAEPNQKPEF